MHRFVRVALVAATTALTSPLDAQDTSPQAGTWGAETGSGNGISVMRFRSTTSAWLLGFSVNHQQRDIGTQEVTIANHELRLGFRRYANPEQRVRPISGVSVIVGYEDLGGTSGMRYGGAGELGAVYFFSRHVSLGTSVDLTVTYSSGEVEAGFPPATLDQNSLIIRSGLRLLGAVYF
jgi:hypothetical protein